MIIGIAFVNSFWLVDELTLVLSKISFYSDSFRNL